MKSSSNAIVAINLKLLILSLIIFRNVSGVNILYIGAMCSPSHHIWNKVISLGLVEKGHNVTLIGPDQDTALDNPPNYSHILLEDVYQELHEEFDLNELAKLRNWDILKSVKDWTIFQCRLFLNSQGFREIYQDYPANFHFDLIVYDISIGYCLHPLISRFSHPPLVAVSAFALAPYNSHNFGNNLVPACIPWFGHNFSNDMNFFQRVRNYFMSYSDLYHKNLIEHREIDKVVEDHFGKGLPKSVEVERNFTLLLSNTDPILFYPQPLPPNIIPVGGLHTKTAKKLPRNLESILDESDEYGVIVFSLGTNIRSDHLNPQVLKALLGAFGQLKETVIWKFESKIENLPKNVIVMKWLPQNDILGHPNVRLFIGHGGSLSTQEAIYHGVPMICIPFIIDQYSNSALMVEKKLGLKLEFDLISNSEYVLNKIHEVSRNPIYHRNMKLASKRFRDQPQTPLEKAIFWIEYVLKHGHANFLNPKSRDLPFYQSTGADVITFLLFLIILFIALFCKTVKMIANFLVKPSEKFKSA